MLEEIMPNKKTITVLPSFQIPYNAKILPYIAIIFNSKIRVMKKAANLPVSVIKMIFPDRVWQPIKPIKFLLSR